MVVVVVVVEVVMVVEVAVVEEVMSVGGRTRCFSLPVGMVVFGGGSSCCSIFFVFLLNLVPVKKKFAQSWQFVPGT